MLQPFDLAASDNRYRDVVVAMIDKLNRLIEAVVGEDGEQMLPGGRDACFPFTRQWQVRVMNRPFRPLGIGSAICEVALLLPA